MIGGFGDRRIEDSCIWCNRSDGALTTIRAPATDRLGRDVGEETFVVHPRHAEDARSFLRFAARSAGLFVKGIALALVVAVGLTALVGYLEGTGRDEDFWASVLFGPYCILVGLFIVRYPLATPETVRWLGLKKSKTLVRIPGWVLVALGGWLLTLAL